jgi:hypothetical protein
MAQVDSLMLADAAAVENGKFYIHGAGWDTIYAPVFPLIHPALVVPVLLRMQWTEANMARNLELDIVNADGASILPTPPGPVRGPVTVGRPPQVLPGADLLVPLVFNLQGIPFEQPGTYALVMRIEGGDDRRYQFHVQYHPNVQPPTRVMGQP